MVIALLVSLLVIAAGALEVGAVVEAQVFVRRIELLAIELYSPYLLTGLAMIPLILGARFISVAGFIGVMRRSRPFSPGVVKITTWGGLHGGISEALAMSIPVGKARDEILTITYVVVIFSILVQGLTVGKLIRHSQKNAQ